MKRFATALIFQPFLLLILSMVPVAHAFPQAIEPWGKETGKLVLVKDGKSEMPIVIFDNAPPLTRNAAEELADYIEKTSGARPKIIDGTPDPLPAHAIWVGYQPVLDQLFPQVDFTFNHREEIIIAANDQHLVIAGKDVWNPDALVGKIRSRVVHGIQLEYGTANAIYTFIQEGLGVRWLWPDDTGEDILKKDTFAIDPFVFRYHPSFVGRDGFLRYSALGRRGPSDSWTRRQRLQLSSLYIEGGHSFTDWWDRFHLSHPEYFALQPDGTRSAFPTPKNVKLCQSNPAVWHQWLKDVEAKLLDNPNMTIFSVSPNDSWASGHCMCENCRAWDHPDGEKRTFYWQGTGLDYPAMSDRHITFANHCARLIKERFPDKDYFVTFMPYGNSRPAPIKARPLDNVMIANVANFMFADGQVDRGSPNGVTHKQQYEDWGKITSNQWWRPNLTSPAGQYQGQMDVPLKQGIADIKFAASLHCKGIYVDSIWEHWGTQGPLYYVMGQLLWDPTRDGQVILDDYYRRGFGPAAQQIKDYWQLAEDTRNLFVASSKQYWEIYDDAFFARASGLLNEAEKTLASEPAIYSKRIEMFRAGLEWTKLVIELRQIMAEMKAQGKSIPQLDAKARANWKRMEEIGTTTIAIRWNVVSPQAPRMKFLHPDNLVFKPASKTKTPANTPAAQLQDKSNAVYSEASTTGWRLAFSDSFDRKEMGEDWKILSGSWKLVDGELEGSGAISLATGYPQDAQLGYQRLEFEARAVNPVGTIQMGNTGQTRVSDMSSFLNASTQSSDEQIIKTGYFFQIGGRWNTIHSLMKNGSSLKISKDPKWQIKADTKYKVVVENDAGHIKLFVDEKPVLDFKDTQSILDKDNGRAGLYFYTTFRVDNLKLYVKKLANDLDHY